jgi:3-isopropylmalate/(R)-2-methylmalate dehydratase large subunit
VPTLSEQIIRSKQVSEPQPGSDYFQVEPDLILGHEATIALLIGRLRKAGRKVHSPEKCFFAADHFVPPATSERADILNTYLRFVQEEGIATNLLYRGISHQLLVEDSRCHPGAMIAGADSHTTMGGALGAFAAGFGSTDILALLATGRLFMAVPKAMAIRLHGTKAPYVSGKDIALEMMRRLGEGGARYRAIEFFDDTGTLSMATRCTLTNMAVDCGAKNGLFAPDQITTDYMTLRDGCVPRLALQKRPDASEYVEWVDIDLSALEPVVARPGSPSDVVPARESDPESIHQVFIGSCCGGRLEDLHEAVEVLAGRTVPPTVRFVVTPASQQVYLEAVKDGTVAKLVESGAMVTSSSCGACGGIDKGVLGPGEVCVSTSNRNFRGRMGHVDSRIYLASARTAAACALAGHIIDPREVIP